MRKQIALFTMECEGETAECYAKLFTLINKAIGKVLSGDQGEGGVSKEDVGSIITASMTSRFALVVFKMVGD